MQRAMTLRSSVLVAALTAGSIVLAATPASSVAGGTAAGTAHAYTAEITVGDHDRGCSGTLVDAEWLLTAASCFAEDPAAGTAVPAGVPRQRTTAVIGRADLTGTQGAERRIVELVPRTDRDVVLARLNRPVTAVTPIALATTAPTAGEELAFAGYGRTQDEWAPLKLHTGTYTVDSADGTTAAVTGKDGAAACAGDSGGPVVRSSGGTVTLAALVSRSFRGGCFGTDETVTATGGVAARVDDLTSWVESQTGKARITDFNGDGVEDIAIGDPKATVGGHVAAGLVRIVHGGGKGTAEINQDLDWVPGGAEDGDWFGESLATVDYNEDGYTDLVVGIPAEDVGSEGNAGFVDVLYGGSGGLGTGTQKYTHLEQGVGSGAIAGSASEAGDRMGHSVAAGTTAAGEPWLLIGVPGEALGAVKAAGMAFYVRGGTSVSLHQDKPGVPGGVEADDAFGSSVTGDAHHLAVGVPGEAIGTNKESGAVALFGHTLDAQGMPTVVGGLDQDTESVSGAAEPGDEFGASVAMADYRVSGASQDRASVLVIGSPGEDLTVDGSDRVDAGRAILVRIDASGTWTYLRSLNSGTNDDDVTGTAETGDRFAETVAVVNTAPRQVGSTGTMRIAVGAPGEAIGTVAGAGAVTTFSPFGAAGAADRWLEAGDGDGIPVSPGTGHHLGRSLHFTSTHLYVGMPYGPSAHGALYALPISNVTAGGVIAPVTAYEPGTGGLPANGARFGWAAR
ncbi:trypsin-like serine protease [Streptomyces sp. NPDC059171]|uniref:trypsin-like serine protease n=1 Tax=Streptomyces sp. NPDC059171 TaxID=3346755 RepID=UPI00368A288A